MIIKIMNLRYFSLKKILSFSNALVMQIFIYSVDQLNFKLPFFYSAVKLILASRLDSGTNELDAAIQALDIW